MSVGRRIVNTKPNGFREKITSLDEKHGIFQAAKFGIASATGFLLAEGILTLGVLRLYGKMSVPGTAQSSPAFLALDIAALALGVAVAFIINERFTVRDQQTHKRGRQRGLVARLLKFEGVNAVGNAAAIGVQLALLVSLSITPVIGNVAGAIVAYPITYLISMRFVWKPAAGDSMSKGQARDRSQTPKKIGPISSPVAVVIVLALFMAGQIARSRKR